VHIQKALLVVVERGLVFVLILNMYTIHLDTLGIIHDCKCIAETINRKYSAYEIKTTRKRGAVDRSFLLDTVRHISSYRKY
jgi:hypothetical protein